MCITNFSTSEELKIDLIEIKQKLLLVGDTNPKIYKAINPIITHLINHLEKQINFIDDLNKNDNDQDKNFEDSYLEVKNKLNQSIPHKEFCRELWKKAKQSNNSKAQQ